jgi:hypothetical protein
MVRPSRNNLHEFVAEENTCFFDICLPNYTADILRRITYFREVLTSPELKGDTSAAQSVLDQIGIDPSTIADCTKEQSSKVNGLKFIEYYTTPPVLPADFDIADLAYRGEMK